MKKFQRVLNQWQFRLLYLITLVGYSATTIYQSIDSNQSATLLGCHVAISLFVWGAAMIPHKVSGLRKSLYCYLASVLMAAIVCGFLSELTDFNNVYVTEAVSLNSIREVLGMGVYYLIALKTFVHSVCRF